MDSTETITHISLCAGYGGIDTGIGKVVANLRTIAFSEIEAFACANLVAKMEEGYLDAAPIWTDLRTFPWKQFHGKVDILSGGFPCQPFSSAGKRAGDEDPRHLFPHILRGITECKPRFVFLENVEGIISAKLKGDGWRDPAGTPVLLHVLRELERVGYRATAGVFSSAEIGATHQRKRVFFLAVADTPSGRAVSAQLARQLRVLGGSRQEFRPMPPGPAQWWWEPSRVIRGNVGNAPQRDERRIGQRGVGAGEEADEKRTTDHDITDGSGENRGDVAHDPRNGRREGWAESGGEQGRSDAAERGESTVGDAQGQRHGAGRLPFREGEKESVFASTGQSMGNTLSDQRQQRELVSDRGQTLLSRSRRDGEQGRERESIYTGADAPDGNGQAESSLGGDPHGNPDWMDYAELSQTVDSRTDELRLLGNGVDPDVVAKAFMTLFNRLSN